jgi:Arc/MetJ family transcription regulator
MSRTNIDIDDELIARVMRRYDLRTKKDAVDFALRSVAWEPMTRDEALAMQGTGWDGDLEAMRSSDVAEW